MLLDFDQDSSFVQDIQVVLTVMPYDRVYRQHVAKNRENSRISKL